MTPIVYKRCLRAIMKTAKWRLELAVIKSYCKYYFLSFNFPIIGMKNNQSSVSDADQEIPTLGSTDNLVSGIIPREPSGQRIMPEMRFISFPALSVYPRVWISRSASKTNYRFYLSQSGLYPKLKLELQHMFYQNVLWCSRLYHS